MRDRIFLLALAFGLLLSGCSSRPETVSMPNLPQAMPVNPPEGSHMLTVNTYAGDALNAMLVLRLGSRRGILATSLVDMDDFERTSAFGRIAAQQVGSRLGQYGHRVLEARLANTLVLERRNGEFMLTRDARRVLADTHDADAVLVGCYSDAGRNVFVSVRVVRLSDNAVMAAYEYYLPRDAEVGTLLDGGGPGRSGGGVWDRHNRRERAFAPETSGPASPVAAGVKKTAPAPRPAAVRTPPATPQKDTPAPQQGAAVAPPPAAPQKDTPAPQPESVIAQPPAAPEKDTPAPHVPRHVDPDPLSTPFSSQKRI